MANRIKGLAPLLVIVMGGIMVNCAGTPDVNPAVQKAQKEYNEIEDDSLVVAHASFELKKAKEALADAQKSMERGDSKTSVEQKALLAQQRIIIARRKAQLEAAQNQLHRMSNELQALQRNAPQMDEDETDISQTELKDEVRMKRLTNFETQQTSRGLVIRFESGNFELGKTYLKSNAAGAINELADFLNAYPKRNVLIEGHTDSTGSKNINQKLSLQRAIAVRDALEARGVAAARMQAIGLGEQFPRVSNKTEAGRAYNRRVEIIVSDSSGTIPPRQ
ncbi:MAG: OmpA family protein [Balneolaceae bacterium]|nr:OmpA family protein [Balneolaceae bacterium]